MGLCPDLKSPLNDLSTMNKTMEYMAYCLPSVSFDLVETRISGGDTVLYVPSGDVGAFADAVERLLDDDDLRVELGLRARSRVADELDWQAQAAAYVSVLDSLTGRSTTAPPESIATRRSHDELGRPYIDLHDPVALADFVRHRARTRRPPTYPGLRRPRTGAVGGRPRGGPVTLDSTGSTSAPSARCSSRPRTTGTTIALTRTSSWRGRCRPTGRCCSSTAWACGCHGAARPRSRFAGWRAS